MCSLHIGNLWSVIFLLISVRNPKQFHVICNKAMNETGFWSEVGRTVGFLMQNCNSHEFKEHDQVEQKDHSGLILEECLKRKGLRAIDRALSRDIIEISEGVFLVKWKNATEVDDSSLSSNRKPLKEKTSKSLENTHNWEQEFLQKIVTFFRTRLLRIHFKGVKLNSISEARGRRKNNMFGQLMMFGLVAAGLIVIPLGFQFLAVLGGKALLLAKLALLLTSIQGLKKIATSPVNYGLYSTGHGGAWQYDRQWPYDLEPYPSTVYTSIDNPPDIHVHTAPHQSTGYHTLHPRLEETHHSLF